MLQAMSADLCPTAPRTAEPAGLGGALDCDEDGRELAAAVATNLARIRTNLCLDVDTLAEWSGLPAELLSALEAGRVVPRLRTLWALARTFEVPLGLLISGSRFADASPRVLRADRGRVLASADGRFRSRAVSTAGDPREPEVYEVSLAPACVEEAAAHAPDTFEHIIVVRGTLVIRAAELNATLHPGDAVFFKADGPHAYENPGGEETRLHLTMTYAGDWVPEAPA